MLLTEGIALHFKSSHLIRDVIPIIDKWRRDGAELVFDVKEFADTFDIVVETERQFNVFDTDRNGKIDAHEVLMVYILLSCGDVGRKLDTAISVYALHGVLQGMV
jgi:Ca2+-binding EF-hand superfamily protein